jgi:Tol biopolymer transport system component
VAPDGRRLLYSSYHGGQWHQLWLTTTADAAPLPLTYGAFDRRNARWSPDGSRVAFVRSSRSRELVVAQLDQGTELSLGHLDAGAPLTASTR